jgi:hypothetical protein
MDHGFGEGGLVIDLPLCLSYLQAALGCAVGGCPMDAQDPGCPDGVSTVPVPPLDGGIAWGKSSAQPALSHVLNFHLQDNVVSRFRYESLEKKVTEISKIANEAKKAADPRERARQTTHWGGQWCGADAVLVEQC